MGKIRLDIQNDLEDRKLVPIRSNTDNKFVWIVDFPMFTKNEAGEYESVHHPFTAPHPQDQDMIDNPDDWLKIRSLAYDLVLNGQEIGGGSMRIHDAKLQKKVLEEILKIEFEHLKHLIEALKSGCPPHGGIALGIDRLMSIICNTKSIRDVIAFPKGLEGKDPMSKAPVDISDEEKKLYHINIVDKIDSNSKESDSIVIMDTNDIDEAPPKKQFKSVLKNSSH